MRFFRRKQAKPDPEVDTEIKCSFCYKPASEVKRIISAPNHVYICDECVERCVDLLKQELPKEHSS